MKLVAKIIDAPMVPGGKALALHDEAGEMLPCQVYCDIATGVDSARITVEFIIDGDGVRLES